MLNVHENILSLSLPRAVGDGQADVGAAAAPHQHHSAACRGRGRHAETGEMTDTQGG